MEAEAVKTRTPRRAQYEGNLVIATHLTRSTEDIDGTVEALLTHTPPLQLRAMGYQRIWVLRVPLKPKPQVGN